MAAESFYTYSAALSCYVSLVVLLQCSDFTPILIGMHRNAPLSPMKRVHGYTIPMVPNNFLCTFHVWLL